MHFSTNVLAGICLANSLASAHMLLSVPLPFAGVISSPLEPDGSNYPCQLKYGQVQRTAMALGSTQPLAFTGGATHGGGSCQISITYDLEPTANSHFRVIHSIEGGCPQEGSHSTNFGTAAGAPGPSQYTFTIPDYLPPGDATLAWTWFNRIGNREMYMNCAPITIGGGVAKRDARAMRRSQAAFDKLPEIFKANIGNGCATKEGIDYAFPDPGESVERLGTEDPVLVGGSCGQSSSPAASVPAAVSVSVAVPSSTATVDPVKPNPGGPKPAVFAEVDSDYTEKPKSTTTSIPAVATNAAVVPAAGEKKPAAVETTSATGAMSGACTTEGTWNCLDGSSFQRCSSGLWSAVQQLAAGMECKTGQSMDFGMSAKATVKRSIRGASR